MITSTIHASLDVISNCSAHVYIIVTFLPISHTLSVELKAAFTLSNFLDTHYTIKQALGAVLSVSLY